MLKQEDDLEQHTGTDKADEFVRNFFIKYGMKRTIDAFQVTRCGTNKTHSGSGSS